MKITEFFNEKNPYINLNCETFEIDIHLDAIFSEYKSVYDDGGYSKIDLQFLEKLENSIKKLRELNK